MNVIIDKPKIGIVSGVGPLAGADVLAKIFAYAADAHGAHEDSDYPDVILLNHGIKGVDNTATINPVFASEIIEMTEKLESWGASIIGIACNTAHVFLSDIHLKPSTTLINLIDVVSGSAALSPGTYGLLTSRGTKDQRLYHAHLERHGVSFRETTEEQQRIVDKSIDEVMAHNNASAKELLQTVIKDMEAGGIHQFIAGCTELPLALPDIDNRETIIDSNELLARSLVDAYYALPGVRKPDS